MLKFIFNVRSLITWLILIHNKIHHEKVRAIVAFPTGEGIETMYLKDVMTVHTLKMSLLRPEMLESEMFKGFGKVNHFGLYRQYYTDDKGELRYSFFFIGTQKLADKISALICNEVGEPNWVPPLQEKCLMAKKKMIGVEFKKNCEGSIDDD